MAIWRFFDLVSPTGRNYIEDWRRKDLQVAEQEEMTDLLAVISKMQNWKHEPFYKALSIKGGLGFGELRFKGANRQVRVIGNDNSSPLSYNLFVGCTHKGKVYNPPDAFATAVQRKKNLDAQLGVLHERKA